MSKLDIWCIPFKDLMVREVNKNILSQDELKIANKFLKKQDTNKYILTHSYLRMILTKYYPYVDEQNWKFVKNEYGKPSLSKEHSSNLYFNISHCFSCAYIIFSPYENSGIDVEDIKHIDLGVPILNLILCKEEEKHFTKQDNSLELFYTYWTLKEAHLKALGCGLSMNPNQIDFSSKISFQQKKKFFKLDSTSNYWTHNINNKVILSYSVLDTKEDNLTSTFYNVKDL